MAEAAEEGFGLNSLDGLAAAWEGSQVVRQNFRETGSLLTWPHAVGVPSMILACAI